MPWGRMDDKFHRNPKQLAMSDGAYRLWTLSWSYCMDMLEPTGFLSTAEALAFARSHRKGKKTIEELVDKQGWEMVGGGYLVHDLEKYLPHTSTARVKRFRDSKRNVTETPSETDRNVSSRATGLETTSTSENPVPVPEPVPGDFEMKPQRNGAGQAARLRDVASSALARKGDS